MRESESTVSAVGCWLWGLSTDLPHLRCSAGGLGRFPHPLLTTPGEDGRRNAQLQSRTDSLFSSKIAQTDCDTAYERLYNLPPKKRSNRLRPRLYADRTAGGHCDHSHPGELTVAGFGQGQDQGPGHSVPEQQQTTPAG